MDGFINGAISLWKSIFGEGESEAPVDIWVDTKSRQRIEGLEFRQEAKARDISLHIISIQMVFKGFRLAHFDKEIIIERSGSEV